MRTSFVVLVASACTGAPTGRPAPSGLAVDTDLVADTDGAGDTDVADTDEGAQPDCLDPLPVNDPFATWDAVVDAGRTQCLQTSTCVGSGRSALRVQRDEGFYTWNGFYDADGRVYSEDGETDAPTCVQWWGVVADTCVGGEVSDGSEGCAVPQTAIALPPDGCLLPDPPTDVTVGTWGEYDPTTVGAEHCVGTSTCTVGDRALDLIYRVDMFGEQPVDAWDHTTGAHVASLDPNHRAASACSRQWEGVDLSSCFPATFTPSAACRVVSRP